MNKNNNEIRKMLDKDLEDWNFKKHFSSSKRENKYKYGDDNGTTMIEGEIPQWAKDALSDHKPGDTVGTRRRYS